MKLHFAVKKFIKDVEKVEKNVAYGSALTLTKAAFHVRQETQKALPKWLTIRRPFLARQVFYRKATRSKLESSVGFGPKADYVTLLEKGGTRRPRRATRIAIPLGVKASPNAVVPKRLRPSVLLNRKDVFRANIKGIEGIFQRLPGNRIKLLYNLEPHTTYDANQMEFLKLAYTQGAKYITDNLGQIVKDSMRK